MAISLDEALGMSLADEVDESIHVDIDTRQITIPESQKLFGVESDADVEVKHIVIDGRYADGNRDLSKLAWRVVYRNAKKGSGYYLIPSVVANKNSIEMDWLIKRSVVAYKGTVDFILCAFATTSSGEVTPEWNSTLGQGIVLKGLETSAIDIGKESVDELSKILYETVTAKDAAAKSASDAQDVADSLPEDYTTAVNEIAALKQQVANITPDDSAIGGKPWSSKHIIDMLCPPLEESGNPVVCYPVAGYALGVKASWEPVQEGSGTPSPENIRPIKGRDSVRVERCGENLIDSDRVTEVSAAYGLTAQYVSGKITISGIYSNSSAHASFPFMSLSYKLPPTTKFMHLGSKSVGCKVDGIRFTNKNRDKIAIDLSGLTTGEKAEISFYLIAYVDTTAPTTYTPYIGQTNTLPLPETVYGGEVDAVSGEGQETQKFVILNGTESWNSWGINAHNPAITGFYTYGINDYDAKNAKGICSHLETPNQDVWGGRNAGIGFATVGSSRYFMFSILTSSIPDISAGHEVASLKAYLAAQNDAGTPVQIAYKLAEPVPITATGAQPIPALAGANTVLTDADSVAVTGRADPIKRITDLEAAVASIN